MGYLIVNQQNSGISAARNEDLRHAKGEYVWYVDPDDLIAPQSLAWADEKLKRNPNLKVIRYYRHLVEENVDASKLLSQIYTPETPQAPTAISLIVDRNHLMENNITFNQVMAYGEDTLWVFLVKFLTGDENIGDGGKVNYFYRVRKGSAMQTRNAESKRKHLKSMETMLGEYERILNERGSLLGDAKRWHLQTRIDWSVQNVLFDSLIVLPKAERKELFDKTAYKQRSLNWGRLSTRYGLSNLLVDIIGLPLKYKPYYTLMGWLISKMKK